MVSVIVTTYKRTPQIVERAILSVVKQTYCDWELIVVDDSPTDYAEREKVKEHIYAIVKNNPITYICNEKNMGACYSRNRGLSVAKGEYVAFLDDDDEWTPEKLGRQVLILDNSLTNVAMVYCSYYLIDENSLGNKIIVPESLSDDPFITLLYKGNIIGGMSMPLIKSECIVAVGNFDIQMQSAQDYDLWLRLAEKYDIEYIDEPLVIYHEHGGERITNNITKQIKGLERINEKYASYIDKDRKLWAIRNQPLITFYAANGNYRKAFYIWLRCVSKCPYLLGKNLFYLASFFRWCLFR